jgi:primosomal protein N' (replication factor Y)
VSLPAGVAHVVVDLPIPRVFSYTIPPAFAPRLAPGQRVRVPFRGRARSGVVVGLAPPEPAAREPIEALLDPVPALTPPLLELTRWAAEETATAWGETVARALPPPARSVAPPILPAASVARSPESLIVVYGAERARVVETAARRAVEGGGAVLLLAPEIETARTWAGRLEQALAEPVLLVTSDDTARRRWEAWWRCRRGDARVAVGTRAAAFLPLAGLSLTIVVDEHDPAHKALDAPRWHARELALRRTRLEGGGCRLVSGTPSLEAWAHLRSAEAVAEEAKGPAWPDVHRVDLRVTALPTGAALSAGLREAARQALAAGHAVILVLNRLGYGRALACAECGAVHRCPDCRVTLTYHLQRRLLTCRLCGGRRPAASRCGRCHGRRLTPLGWGTERLEVEARAAFPGVGVARYDGELSPARAAALRAAVRAGDVRVVVGTQMALRLCAETAVGLAALVHADATLHLPDFRAAERTFQLAWHLAEGLTPGGSLWLQSFYPEHPALESVALGAREVFYQREWAEREELGYPPVRRLARIVAEGGDAGPLLRDLAGRAKADGLTVLGPAPMPGGRAQLALLGDGELPQAMARLLQPLRGRRRLGAVRLLVDVDPVELP